MILSKKRITKALIRLCRYAGWAAPLLFTNHEGRFSLAGTHMITGHCGMTEKKVEVMNVNKLKHNIQ